MAKEASRIIGISLGKRRCQEDLNHAGSIKLRVGLENTRSGGKLKGNGVR